MNALSICAKPNSVTPSAAFRASSQCALRATRLRSVRDHCRTLAMMAISRNVKMMTVRKAAPRSLRSLDGMMFIRSCGRARSPPGRNGEIVRALRALVEVAGFLDLALEHDGVLSVVEEQVAAVL